MTKSDLYEEILRLIRTAILDAMKDEDDAEDYLVVVNHWLSVAKYAKEFLKGD